MYQPPEGSEVNGATNVIAQQTRWYIKETKTTKIRNRNPDNKKVHQKEIQIGFNELNTITERRRKRNYIRR
jgi:hypothetical protein